MRHIRKGVQSLIELLTWSEPARSALLVEAFTANVV